MNPTTQFSFPTVTIPGIGVAVSRKCLIECGGITGNDIYALQGNLQEGVDYTCTNLGGRTGCAQNYYSLIAVIKLAKMAPTHELQALASEIRGVLYGPPTQHTLPAASHTPAMAYPVRYHEQRQPQAPQPFQPTVDPVYQSPHRDPQQVPYSVAQPISQHVALTGDPRVFQFADAVAGKMRAHQPSQMTQQQLFDGIRSIQKDTVDHVQAGFNLGMSAMAQTSATIRKSRPHVVNNTDNRAMTLIDYVSQSGGRFQSALFYSAVFCVVFVSFYGITALVGSRERDRSLQDQRSYHLAPHRSQAFLRTAESPSVNPIEETVMEWSNSPSEQRQTLSGLRRRSSAPINASEYAKQDAAVQDEIRGLKLAQAKVEKDIQEEKTNPRVEILF